MPLPAKSSHFIYIYYAYYRHSHRGSSTVAMPTDPNAAPSPPIPPQTTKIFSLNPIASRRHPHPCIYMYNLRFPRQGHVGSGMRVGRRRLPCSSSSRRRSLMFCLALAHTHTRSVEPGETVGTTNACVFLSITGALPFKQWPLDRLQMGVCARTYTPATREQDESMTGRRRDGKWVAVVERGEGGCDMYVYI